MKKLDYSTQNRIEELKQLIERSSNKEQFIDLALEKIQTYVSTKELKENA